MTEREEAELWARAAVADWLARVMRTMAGECEALAQRLRREERRWA